MTNKFNPRRIKIMKNSQQPQEDTKELKQIFEKKKYSKSKDVHKSQSRDQKKKKVSPRANSSLNYNKDDQSTIKIHHRQDDLDVRAHLTPQQYQKFGDRFPQKFKRVALLGRGGFSVVWLGVHRTTKKKVAIKQILTKNPHQTHLKEIWFGSYFFEKGGQPREQFQNHIGINNICRMYYHEIKTIDTWLYYQICQQSLGSSLFDLKGQTINGQRSYKVSFKPLILQMKQNINELKTLIIQISKALFLMNSHNIVHSDLKTQNVLIKVRGKNEDESQTYLKGIKLIDFGSSFLFTNLKQFSMATPQYMPPQILNYILYQNKLQYDNKMLQKMQKYTNPWVVDVWSLGCIILQIISGLPLWMSIPTKVQGRSQKTTGLFAVKGRLFNKIILKQIQVIQTLENNLKNKNFSGIQADDQIKRVLKKMLHLNPDQRISPLQILNEFGVPCKPQKMPFY